MDQTPLSPSPMAVAGRWHDDQRPAHNAAFRLAYLMMFERYAPSAILKALDDVFVASGLLTPTDIMHVVSVSVQFARMEPAGNA